VSSAKQRHEYRRALSVEEHAILDSLHAKLRALEAGSMACAQCTLVKPRDVLDADGVCTVCRSRPVRRPLAPSRGQSFHRDLAEAHARPIPDVEQLVTVDASYADGVAGLAVVGVLGEHAKRVDARSSAEAEVLAMAWAMDLAREQDMDGVVFQTDNTSACHYGLNRVRRSDDWHVRWVPRRFTSRADRLAARARLEAA
jgi:hypothetical protein